MSQFLFASWAESAKHTVPPGYSVPGKTDHGPPTIDGPSERGFQVFGRLKTRACSEDMFQGSMVRPGVPPMDLGQTKLKCSTDLYMFHHGSCVS